MVNLRWMTWKCSLILGFGCLWSGSWQKLGKIYRWKARRSSKQLWVRRKVGIWYILVAWGLYGFAGLRRLIRWTGSALVSPSILRGWASRRCRRCPRKIPNLKNTISFLLLSMPSGSSIHYWAGPPYRYKDQRHSDAQWNHFEPANMRVRTPEFLLG